MNLNPRVCGANFAGKGLRSTRACTFRLVFTAAEHRLRSERRATRHRQEEEQATSTPRAPPQESACLPRCVCLLLVFPVSISHFFLPLQSASPAQRASIEGSPTLGKRRRGARTDDQSAETRSGGGQTRGSWGQTGEPCGTAEELTWQHTRYTFST